MELIEKSETPVLVDFYAHWCGPCKIMSPILNSIAQTFKGQILVVKVDIDQKARLAAYFNVSAVPTLLLLYKSEVLWRQSGAISFQQLSDVLQRELRKLSAGLNH